MEQKKKQVAIVHFNTPELTEACVWSIRKHGGREYQITIFDNSDKRPFKAKLPGVTVIDNTKGQVVNFDTLLSQFPKRMQTCNEWGSDKHMWSIQKLWELLPDGFVLMDSDIIRNIDFMWQGDQCAVGHVQSPQPGVASFQFCYINVPLCRKHGLTYLTQFATGSVRADLELDTPVAILRGHSQQKRCGRRIDIRPLMEHFKKGSWQRTGIKEQAAWLQQHRKLWEPTPQMRGVKKIAVCAYRSQREPLRRGVGRAL